MCFVGTGHPITRAICSSWWLDKSPGVSVALYTFSHAQQGCHGHHKIVIGFQDDATRTREFEASKKHKQHVRKTRCGQCKTKQRKHAVNRFTARVGHPDVLKWNKKGEDEPISIHVQTAHARHTLYNPDLQQTCVAALLIQSDASFAP